MRMRVDESRKDHGLSKLNNFWFWKSRNDFSAGANCDYAGTIDGDGAVFEHRRDDWQDPARGIDDGHFCLTQARIHSFGRDIWAAPGRRLRPRPKRPCA